MKIPTDKDEIWDLFYPSPKELDKDFKYFKTYYKYIAPYKFEIIRSEENFKMYCLISFFTHYRCCNHIGIEFNSGEHKDEKEVLKFLTLEYVIGQKVRSTFDYIHLIELTPLKIHNYLLPMSWMLFYTVKPNWLIKLLNKLPRIDLFKDEKDK